MWGCAWLFGRKTDRRDSVFPDAFQVFPAKKLEILLLKASEPILEGSQRKEDVVRMWIVQEINSGLFPILPKTIFESPLNDGRDRLFLCFFLREEVEQSSIPSNAKPHRKTDDFLESGPPNKPIVSKHQ